MGNDITAGKGGVDFGAEMGQALAALEGLFVRAAKELGSGAKEDLEKYALGIAKDTKRALGNSDLQKELRAQMHLLEERYRVRFEQKARSVLAGILDILEQVGGRLVAAGIAVL